MTLKGLIGMSAAVAVLSACGEQRPEMFTPALWSEGAHTCDEETNAIRMWIWKDLDENHMRVGMTRAETIALLGEPGRQSRDGNAIYYCLGRRVISNDEYAVDFDANGRVTSHRYRPG